jgi:phosphoribosylformylglycinamidine synthase
MASAIAIGAGNPVYIVGSATGRDGIHGATFASEEISEASEAKRPSVQVGDPFTEKLLLEATLEVIQSGVVVGIQDMGAAGITCSSCEMSAKGESGMIIHVDRVPMRETGMTPYEVMLSESQERMLIVCRKGEEAILEAIFEKWDLHAVQIGEVIDEERVKIFWHGELVADVPPQHLVLGGGAPVYHRETKRPGYLDETLSFRLDELTDLQPAEAAEALLGLLGSPNIASKQWVFEQYDTMVRTNTVAGPGPTDAAVVRIKGSRKGLAVKTDCNGRYVYLNPRRGGQIAVVEAARNVVCSGGQPVAITNCLNFGNPYKPEVYWVFTEAVGGMGDACRALETPVTGGNVSFYNENPAGAVFPTPTIGMLGVVDDVERHTTTASFKTDGDRVLLLSPAAWAHRDDLGGSEYLATLKSRIAGDAPHMELAEERAVQKVCLEMIRAGLISAAHDLSDGGLAVALAEMCIFSGDKGARISFGDGSERLDCLLFGEAQSRILLTTAAEHVAQLSDMAAKAGARITELGTVTGERLVIMRGDTTLIDLSVPDVTKPYAETIPSYMNN